MADPIDVQQIRAAVAASDKDPALTLSSDLGGNHRITIGDRLLEIMEVRAGDELTGWTLIRSTRDPLDGTWRAKGEAEHVDADRRAQVFAAIDQFLQTTS